MWFMDFSSLKGYWSLWECNLGLGLGLGVKFAKLAALPWVVLWMAPGVVRIRV